jgi:hypothetical protein
VFYIADMDNPKSDCNSLLEKTALALDDGALQQLFITAQMSNLKLCIEYGTKELIRFVDCSIYLFVV